MQKQVKVYLNFFDIGETDTWVCEACTKEFPINNGLNIHHIHGRGPGKDVIKNLMSLCIDKCHPRAHSSKNYVSKEEFQYIHNSFLSGQRKIFLK
jgi:hypothetical protein